MTTKPPTLPILDHIIRVTANRDRDTLTQSLAQTLLSMIPCTKVVLWRPCVWQGTQGVLTSEWLTPEGPHHGTPKFHSFLEKPLFQRAAEGGQPVEGPGKEGGNSLILPLRGEKETYVFLELEQAQVSPQDQRVMDGVLSIFRNFVAILEQGEGDTLTGLLNRRTFETRLIQILQAQREAKAAFALQGTRRSKGQSWMAWLAILDIDHFKRINDRFGHAYGDEVLLTFSRLAKKCFRQNDLLFRFGGEEFVVILEPSLMKDAEAALERFRKAVEAYAFPQVGQVTVSMGYVVVDESVPPVELVHQADQALYFAKEHGRNQVVSRARLIEQGLLAAEGPETGPVELF